MRDHYLSQKSSTPRVVLLLSEKSSGSTIFQKEICKHPEISHVAFTVHTAYETFHWVEGACILGMPKQDFLRGKPYFGVGLARRLMTDTIKGNVSNFVPPSSDEALVFEGWNALCNRFQPVFFEKSPHHINHWAALSLILKYVERSNHDVRVIGLVRNPMAVAYSTWKRWLALPEERQFMWAQSYRNLLCFEKLFSSSKFHLVRYEDLVTWPQEVMQSVCRFLDVDYYDDIGSGIHSRSAEKWYSDPDFTLQLDGSVALVAKHFDYTDEDLFNPIKPEPSRTRRRRVAILRWCQNIQFLVFNRLARSIFNHPGR